MTCVTDDAERPPACGQDRSASPLVSVIIVTLNAEQTLERALNSVIGQTDLRWELIVIDGQSRDRTVAILEHYTGLIDYWQSEPDAGLYDAMNKGIDRARGRWLLFLGSDDILMDCLHVVAPQFRSDREI